ncbi:MAG: PQQ-dependent sugar dehydrogenase, partial [Clostridia bacterium]|nr:PQQ-dependent sugar dehydrogenase [Clostridia bacterium]
PLLYAYQTYRTERGLGNRILRFRYDAGSRRLSEPRIILDGIPGAPIHNGGQLRFGPDGRLYATTGDAGRAEDAQDPKRLNGKVLRLEADGRVPEDNPFGPGHPVYSLGHRNPEGLAFQPGTGRLYATEHGSSSFDEVNLIRPGANYGWPFARGRAHGRYAAPLQVYDPTIAPAGADFYTGAYGPWQGHLFFGTLGLTERGGRHLHRLALAADGLAVAEEEQLFTNRFGRIRAVASGPDGCLYFATSNRDGRGQPGPADDRILRLCPEP